MIKIRRGDIWLADLSPTIGREQARKGPVLIISGDLFNNSHANLVFAVPVTSKYKNIRSHISVSPPDGGLTSESFIMCEAARSISKERLIKFTGSVSTGTMGEVEDVLRFLLEL